jgi:hypothetical protein
MVVEDGVGVMRSAGVMELGNQATSSHLHDEAKSYQLGCSGS